MSGEQKDEEPLQAKSGKEALEFACEGYAGSLALSPAARRQVAEVRKRPPCRAARPPCAVDQPWLLPRQSHPQGAAPRASACERGSTHRTTVCRATGRAGDGAGLGATQGNRGDNRGGECQHFPPAGARRESVMSRAADVSRDTSLALVLAALEPV